VGSVYYAEASSLNMTMLYSNGGWLSRTNPVRPVVTLNPEMTIDSSDKSKDGKTAENAWILK